MKTFQVGDRVNSPEGKGKILCTYKSEAWVSIDGKDFCCTFYFSRLKKLKPKPKREPRRVWVRYDGADVEMTVTYPLQGLVEFIEVMTK